MPDKRPKILLADDETAITSNLAPFLERGGFSVLVADDGQAALDRIAASGPDLIILDVLMPRLDGREVLRRLRRSGNWTPVILLTQVGEAAERALALEEGADDYLNKPFDPSELVARIHAVLRRATPGQPPLSSAWQLVCPAGAGPAQTPQSTERSLTLDRRARRATLGTQPLDLTPKAVALLEYMMTHPGELLTRERLLDAVWGWEYPAGTRTVDTRMAELRRALGDDPAHPCFVETLPGEGYRFIGLVSPA
jgi:DNA-binding response OmpR family regulator